MELQRQLQQSPMDISTTTTTNDDDDEKAIAKPKPTKRQRIRCYSADEDEDMANCLILLAQGFNLAARANSFECKTCSRCFPSAQALGGHRASHKKTKPPPPAVYASEKSTLLKTAKVHECLICGSEFSSGQALGGHMRRHRPLAAIAAAESEELVTKKERSSARLSLDLNLPAPPEEEALAFSGERPPLLFSPSASALVDCHY